MPMKLKVAYFDSLPFNHWALYLQHPSKEYEVFQIMGGPGRYRYETRMCKNLNSSKTHIETVDLGYISSTKYDKFKTLAKDTKTGSGKWHCQYWVLELIESLEEKGVTDIPQEDLDKLKKDHQPY